VLKRLKGHVAGMTQMRDVHKSLARESEDTCVERIILKEMIK
jgi:hypothetical protein